MKDDVGKSDVAKGAARTDEAGVSTKETDATAEIQQKALIGALRTQPISAFCWVTGIRTQNDRTKTCSVTITP